MASVRNDKWENSGTVYTEDQVAAVLAECGIDVRDETENDFLSFCPYHGNRDTPAFSTSKVYGVSTCFNPGCSAYSIELRQLIMDTKHCGPLEATRLIHINRDDSAAGREKRFNSVGNTTFEFTPFSQETLDNLFRNFWCADYAIEYMVGRGFSKNTLREFRVGYSGIKDMITVPMHAPDGMPIGLIGRGLHDKVFKNSYKLPKSKTAWNLNNAKRYTTVVIVESSFDAMRVHQAGYPNVVALLGGTLSTDQEILLRRHFDTVIIMTDNDAKHFNVVCNKCQRAGSNKCLGHQPGRELGMKIADRLKGIKVMWATFSDTEVYAHDAKDACDMTDAEIVTCLRNAIPHFEYVSWMVA